MKYLNGLKTFKTILVTNTRSFSDNSSVAADLAVLIAQRGRKVALLDADFRRPIIHELFNIPNMIGFSDILQNHRTALSVMQDCEKKCLSILTSGTKLSNFSDLFNTEKMDKSMRLLKENFDTVIIHGPPFFFAEATVLATRVDRIILLIHPGYNKTETSRAIIDKFQRTGAKIIGIVMREHPKHQAHQSAFIDRLLSYDKRARQYS